MLLLSHLDNASPNKHKHLVSHYTTQNRGGGQPRSAYFNISCKNLGDDSTICAPLDLSIDHVHSPFQLIESIRRLDSYFSPPSTPTHGTPQWIEAVRRSGWTCWLAPLSNPNPLKIHRYWHCQRDTPLSLVSSDCLSLCLHTQLDSPSNRVKRCCALYMPTNIFPTLILFSLTGSNYVQRAWHYSGFYHE